MGSSPLVRRSRIAQAIRWLGPVALAWLSLIVLAHRPSPRAIRMTYLLFGLLLPVSYVLIWGWAISISRTPRRTLFRGMTATLMLLAVLICLEVPAALELVHWRSFFQKLTSQEGEHEFATGFVADTERGFRRQANIQWSGRLASDIEDGWLLPPSLREPITFTYDRWGFRNPPEMEQANIALLGDSYVEGWYVSDNQTAARLLADYLGRPVANLGVAGYGPMQELIVLKNDGVRLNASVIFWFFYEGNDLYDDQNFENTILAGRDRPEITQSWKQRSFTINALRWLRRGSNAILPNWVPCVGRLSLPGRPDQTIYFDENSGNPWTSYEARRWGRSRSALQHGVDFCRERDIHLVLCYIPTKFRVYQPFLTFSADSPCLNWHVWPLPEKFGQFCREAGVPFLDLTDCLQEAIRQGRMPYAAVDTHWGPEGHALVAERLAEELRQRGWQVAARADR
jgi:hypothetical protein